MAEKARAHIFISGRVQGVLFRDSTRRQAKKLGVFGWIKNLPDKRVEIVLEGPKNMVEKMLKWVKNGPILAKVDNLEVNWENCEPGKFDSFEIKY